MGTEVTYGASEHGDPVVTFTVTGGHDIYRLAFALVRAQCDFADVGQGIFRFLVGAYPTSFDALDQSLGSGVARRWALLLGGSSERVEAVTARRGWRCYVDGCRRAIRRGDLHVSWVAFPGSEFNGGDKPVRYRLCLDHAHDPSALPLTAEQIAERDAAVAEVLTSRRPVVVEVRRRGQTCWLCVERRTCTQTPHGWECDRCRAVR